MGYYLILTDQDGADSWPITGASFILVYAAPPDPVATAEALKFFAWAYKNGGPMAAELDYVPLPAALTAQVEATWTAQIKSNGTAGVEGRSSRGEHISTGAKLQPVFRRAGSLRELEHLAWRSSVRSVRQDSAAAGAAPRGDSCGAAMLVLALLGGVAVSLLSQGAWPAFLCFKLAFLTREIWNPVTEEFGALAPIYGTLVTSLIAMLVSRSDRLWRRNLPHRACARAACMTGQGVAIELLAAVPSIIFRNLGALCPRTDSQRHVQP